MKTNWQIKKLGDICEVVGGGTPSTSIKKYWDNDYYWVTPKDLGQLDGFEISKTERKISKLGLKNSSAKLLPVGSVILSSRAPIGYVFINTVEMATNQGCRSFICSENILNKYLYYFLVFNKEYLNKLGTGTTFKEISGSVLKEIGIPLPSILEQKKIVKILDNAFEKIERAKINTEKNLRNSKDLFESYLNKLDGDKKPLGSLVDIKTGKLNANAMKENGKYPFFTCAKEIFAIDTYAFDCEAILLAGNNAVGDFNVKHYKGKFNAYQRTYVITVNKDNGISYRYLYYQLLKSLKEFKGKSVGAGTKFLKIGMIQDLQITLPSLKDQKSIVEKLDQLSEQSKKLESIYQSKLSAIEELKKSILSKAFSKGL